MGAWDFWALSAGEPPWTMPIKFLAFRYRGGGVGILFSLLGGDANFLFMGAGRLEKIDPVPGNPERDQPSSLFFSNPEISKMFYFIVFSPERLRPSVLKEPASALRNRCLKMQPRGDFPENLVRVVADVWEKGPMVSRTHTHACARTHARTHASTHDYPYQNYYKLIFILEELVAVTDTDMDALGINEITDTHSMLLKCKM